jgi:hypothetical protein
MRLLAIDPGNEESALLIYDTDKQEPWSWEKCSNEAALEQVDARASADTMAIEMVASYGMAVGASVFETCVWAGRFIERWMGSYGMLDASPKEPILAYRREVKLHICGSARAKDANIRQALIDRYGGKEKAIGKKATPGPLYGMSGDCWSALAVAVTVAERVETEVYAA